MSPAQARSSGLVAVDVREVLEQIISQNAVIKVTYDSVGRQYAHIGNASHLVEQILVVVTPQSPEAESLAPGSQKSSQRISHEH